MKMKIVQVGEPVLRQAAQPLTSSQIKTRETVQLIESMRETMYEAPGVGLAAPQVGLPLALAVIEDKPEYTKDIPADVLAGRGRHPVPFHVIINPKITLLGEPDVSFFEGCLSLPGFTAVVARSLGVRVECLDHLGNEQIIEASGWYARILQHEIDHLQGGVYIDRMQTRTFMSLENYLAYWKTKSMNETLQALGMKGP
ncbi:MAG TPA: peptide deformylase [Bryobacteraceae bacterium]|jgi:peptide deformylase|nr:peptide deformylase [Bryobacteraceae bacterium]